MTTIAMKARGLNIPEWLGTAAVAVAFTFFALLAWFDAVPFGVIEALGFATGAFSVWWSARNSVWGFPIGIANNVFYFIVFYDAKFYADMWLQVLYVGFALYGIYKWVWGRDKAPSPIRHITVKMGIALAAFVGVMTYVAHQVLMFYNGAAPFWDAFLTALSLAAMTLLVLRVYENWLIWITADIFYIWLFWTRDLPLTSLLYIVFMAECFYALRIWTRDLKTQKDKPLTVAGELRKV